MGRTAEWPVGSLGGHHPHVCQPPAPLPGQHHAFPWPSVSALLLGQGGSSSEPSTAASPKGQGSAGRETYMRPRPVHSKAAHVLNAATTALKVLTMFEEGPTLASPHLRPYVSPGWSSLPGFVELQAQKPLWMLVATLCPPGSVWKPMGKSIVVTPGRHGCPEDPELPDRP